MLRPLIACLALAASLVACTDWNNGEFGRPSLLPVQPGADVGADAAGHADGIGIRSWETWTPPLPDGATVSDDTAAQPDAGGITWLDAVAVDVQGAADATPVTADATGGADGGTTADGASGSDGGALADGGPGDDGQSGADGATADDAWVGDDTWTAYDGSGTADAWPGDDGLIYPDDAALGDSWLYQDGGWIGEVSAADASVPDDAWWVDAGIVDGGLWDSGSTADATVDVNAPDWQGYGDLIVPPGVDINAGALASCSEMYLYQKDTCGPNASADCVASMQTAGSPYANYRFEPLAACESLVCSPLCMVAGSDKCLEDCIGKYCAAQFFSCIDNGASGSASCADTFACSNAADIKGKMWSIAVTCLAKASPAAQTQFAGLIGCVTQPQTKTCIPELAACYADGSAQATCSQTLTCMGGCNGVDTCSNACIGKATPVAVSLIDDFWTCATTQCTPQCGGDKTCQDACFASKCNKQYAACIAN